MEFEPAVSTATVKNYLHSRSRWIRGCEWVLGRRYRLAHFAGRATPMVIVAYSLRGRFRDAAVAQHIVHAVEQDWAAVPSRCREAYDEILFRAPELLIVQLRRKNLCGCLGHRHLVVREAPFAEAHEAFQGAKTGEMDIAYQRVESWLALPLSDIALDTRFLEGSRQVEFRAQQFRLKLLSVLLHEANHLVFANEPETSVRERSLAFYRDALASYVEAAMATLSLTIDRSFSRFG